MPEKTKALIVWDTGSTYRDPKIPIIQIFPSIYRLSEYGEGTIKTIKVIIDMEKLRSGKIHLSLSFSYLELDEKREKFIEREILVDFDDQVYEAGKLTFFGKLEDIGLIGVLNNETEMTLESPISKQTRKKKTVDVIEDFICKQIVQNLLITIEWIGPTRFIITAKKDYEFKKVVNDGRFIKIIENRTKGPFKERPLWGPDLSLT